jgi:hypothetical protein
MKTLFCILFLLFLAPAVGRAQYGMNWRSLREPHLVQVSSGVENGFVMGVGYGYKLPVKQNIVFTADYSFPTGSTVFDDFKSRLSVQSEMVRWKNWSVTLKAAAIFRRYENKLATLSNFGSEFSALAGYARPRWQMMAEFGFDKAISTHVHNSNLLKSYNPDIQDGWYVPTGGYFFYGLQAGYSFARQDLFLRAGQLAAQDFQTPMNLPLYVKIGITHRFGKQE